MNPLDREAAASGVRYRIFIAVAVVWLVIVALMMRSWYLQVLHHEEYLALAQNNKVRVVLDKPERGTIYDRNGNVLVRNIPSFNLALVLDDVPGKKLESTIQQVSALLDLDPAPMLKAAKRQRRTIPYLPVTIREGLTLKQVADVEWAHMPGVVVLAETQREYIYGNTAGHLLGYVGEVTEKQLAREGYENVLPGTRVGQYGVEESYDLDLVGHPGERQIEVDAKGFEVQELTRVAPKVGNDIYLTIDIEVQKVAEEALGKRRGAVVAMDPNSGEILALVSHPVFDPQELSRGISSKAWKKVLDDRAKPLLNRAIQGVYPPGSVFKIPVAAAVLEKLHGGREVFCSGQYPFLDRTFRDWKWSGHGLVGLNKSIVESCDVFYYDYGDRLGIDTIAEYAAMFGYGEKTGIPLAGERVGILPSSQWKKDTYKQVWYPGETLTAAIGQGYVSATPIQVMSAFAAFSTNGRRFVPKPRLGVWDHETELLVLDEPHPLVRASLRKNTYRVLQRAMERVVWSAKGTAKSARSDIVKIAGKTGTAQVVSMGKGTQPDQKDIPWKYRDHAWFAGYAPSRDPQIAVAVIVEHGGHGGATAAPVVKQVIEAYIQQKAEYVPQEQLAESLVALREMGPGA